MEMKTIGITGQNGFIGRHLYNYLGLQEGIELVNFEKEFFDKENDLDQFVKSCDCIVHLAAMNRHEDQQVIYNTNLDLVSRLIASCERTNRKPHIIFSSSSQEANDNPYGLSKKEGRQQLESWASRSGGTVAGLVIPNVFGPFGKPFYNSVVATFCHQIARNEEPNIIKDSNVKLIYINELIEDIYEVIKNGISGRIELAHRHELMVSELKSKLIGYRENYMEKGVMPDLRNPIDLALFNSFRCYIPHSHYPVKFVEHKDPRGAFVEIMRAQTSGQFSYSTTVPGITRGNHFHTRKAERFAVISGKAKIQLRKVDSDEIIEYILDGSEPAYVDMPIWYTHNISNIGDETLITLFWINEPYDAENADTYFVNV